MGGHWMQAILQLRVRPASYQSRPSTLGAKHWPKDLLFDPNFKSVEDLEWLLEDPFDSKITGILFREFGRNADPMLYGETVTRVTHGCDGPQFEWTRLRAHEFRERGY